MSLESNIKEKIINVDLLLTKIKTVLSFRVFRPRAETY